jgi:hypothetical protein
VWLVYGFTRAFSSGLERLVCLFGMGLLTVVMTLNMVTHFMIVKSIPLTPFQYQWRSWGAIAIFVAVLIIVLLITLADPVIRLIRLELRFLGKQEETILNAKHSSLDDEKILQAMQGRAEWEAQQLAQRILGAARQSHVQPQNQHENRAGFVRTQSASARSNYEAHGEQDPNA